jgi:tetratricopeptide (TPR) repeat protein
MPFMRTIYLRCLTALLVLLFASKLPAQNLRDPQFMERTQEGFKDIMNLDYETAQQVFLDMEQEYPRHPAPPLYRASVFWLNEMFRRQDLSLNRFISASHFGRKTNETMPVKERDAFFQAIEKSEFLANEILKKNPRNKDARYFLGTASGLRSSFAITIDHALREAFSNGNKAFFSAKQLIDEDPGYYDAYLTLGIYEYVADNIPWYWKWMAFVLGLRGDKQLGMKYLKLASEKAPSVNNESALVLMVFKVREEKYMEALQLARNLHIKFPRSFIFALNVAQILKLAGQRDQATLAFLEAEKQVEARNPNYDKLQLQTFRFNLGVELMYMEKHDLAQTRFRQCIDDPKTQFRERTLAHLNLGKILIWKGQRTEAAKEFQTVLAVENVDNSHNLARQLLNRLSRK